MSKQCPSAYALHTWDSALSRHRRRQRSIADSIRHHRCRQRFIAVSSASATSTAAAAAPAVYCQDHLVTDAGRYFARRGTALLASADVAAYLRAAERFLADEAGRCGACFGPLTSRRILIASQVRLSPPTRPQQRR
jgi:hypothetical protein